MWIENGLLKVTITHTVNVVI